MEPVEDRRASYQEEAKKDKKSSFRRSLKKILSPTKYRKLKTFAKALKEKKYLKKGRKERNKPLVDGTENVGDSSDTPDSLPIENAVAEEAALTAGESPPLAHSAGPDGRQQERAPTAKKKTPDETNTIKSQDSLEGNNEKSSPKNSGETEVNGSSELPKIAESDAAKEANDGENNGTAVDNVEFDLTSSERSTVRFTNSVIEKDTEKNELNGKGPEEKELNCEGSLRWSEIPSFSNGGENNGSSVNVGVMKSMSSLGDGSCARFSDLLPDMDDNNNLELDDEGSMGSIEMNEMFNASHERSESRLSVTSMSNESASVFRRLAQSDVSTIFTDESLYNLLVCQERMTEWLSSFYHTDPRWQIMRFFDDVAREGANNLEITKSEESVLRHTSPLLKMFARSSVFTVWRPTSLDAIRKMMLREGTGKGLDIKGKSAKKGKLSGYVPFMQIHDNDHKKKVGTLPCNGRIRVFYKTEGEREKVIEVLEPISKEMMRKVNTAKLVLSKDPIEVSDDIWEMAAENMVLQMEDPTLERIDEYLPQCYGVEVPERLFWEGYVARQDCSRELGSEYDTGRPSEPAFQAMNFAAVRKGPQPDKPRAVVWQFDDTGEPMRPTTLLMAYEEKGRVLPVVSDFDAFLVGTRGVRYEDPLPPEQIEIVHWCISQVETILDKKDGKSWTSQWLRVLKENVQKGARHHVPSLGYGDPKSVSIFDHAKRRLEETNGAVRHAAECFNYGFPQEIDDQFLVISDTLPGKVPWKYVCATELQDLLCEKINAGFTFPLHPKWILCDPGWKRVYDRLLASTNTNTQASLNCWFPPESGLRERIETIHSKHPDGFSHGMRHGHKSMITSEMALVEHQLNRYLALMRAKRKLRNIMFWIKFCRQSQRHLRAREEAQKTQPTGSGKNLLVAENDDEKNTDEIESAEDKLPPTQGLA